ncbi:hypothetical protein ASD37_00120 [Mycobacterium sp. Root135]|nr:hypothetical protein ASD37_00120 [Mycobacterium sp. Root135]
MTRGVGSTARRLAHWLAVFGCTTGLVLATAPATHAEPDTGDPTSPFPVTNLILSTYDKVKYDDYFTSSSGGVWFSTPLGLNCGIWDRGSFGCTGDIRGAPPGTTNVGWITGQIQPRYDWALGLQIPPGRAERELPQRNYVEYNGTRCATMADTSTYCQRGPFRFLVTPNRTWLAPP